MVHLNRITTKAGDDGTTDLGDGSRVAKTDPRIAAIGSLDELNSAIGLALASATQVPAPMGTILRQIQNDLFDAGAELCLPFDPADDDQRNRCAIRDTHLTRIEHALDETIDQLQPLESFVLPGGSLLAASLHMARTICRRAERDVLTLARLEPVGRPLLCYLNRLSDLLFVYARAANDAGRSDVLWEPGRADSGDSAAS